MVVILRLGHRPERDKRITTHVALTARAFGASGIFYSGKKDERLEKSVQDVVSRWGGDFWIRYEPRWKAFLKSFDGIIVHLTMYGMPLDDALREIKARVRESAMASTRVGTKAEMEKEKSGEKILVVVGGEKVPGEVFGLANFNISVGNQPHSEVAALAVFLDRFFEGKELDKKFSGAKIRIIPSRKGKRVISGNG